MRLLIGDNILLLWKSSMFRANIS